MLPTARCAVRPTCGTFLRAAPATLACRAASVPQRKRCLSQTVGLRKQRSTRSCVVCAALLKALIFDCDGVILLSEDLHRRAYNDTFDHFAVTISNGERVHWDEEFYEVLQNKIGGGKPKMRWYFGENGWPVSTLFSTPPQTDAEKEVLIDTLQEWKTLRYQELLGSGAVSPREGVARLMAEAREAGAKVAVCSAATKSSVVFTLTGLLGQNILQELDCFLAGDDVPVKKPDPTIYRLAAEKLEVGCEECLVVEDSVIGLQAALGAGMRCIITTTASTERQDFTGADLVVATLGDDPPRVEFNSLKELFLAPV